MTIEQKIQNGSLARDVLENPIYVKAVADIKQELIYTWQSTPARDVEGRERLYMMLKMLEKVSQALTNTMETGTLALEDLKYQQSLLDKVRDAVGLS